jgi:transposase
LLADGYDEYNSVVAGNGITRSGCWSHARRKYVEAEKTAPEIAREAVALISALYAVEKQAKDVSVAERRELRQAQSTPVLAELRRKLLLWKEQLIPKHPMADAVNYTLNQWAQLNVFCSDGAVPIDNNVSTAARGSACRMPTAGLCRAIDHASVPVCFPLVSDAA